MREIDSNQHAWSLLAADHYHAYKKALENGRHQLNTHIRRELKDLAGKRIIHLQCNIGADTILLAQQGAHAVGVDLVPENIEYARKLADDFGVTNIRFIQANIMDFMQTHHEQYDVVFVSEGAIGWLPDLRIWGQTIRHLLNPNGFLYVFDSHPFFLALNEEKLAKNELEIRYPYFGRTPDVDDSIGGYASEPQKGVQAYFWMYTVSDIINSLTAAGLHIEYFNEYIENYFDSGGMQRLGESGLFNFDFNQDQFPMSFSLKASVYQSGNT